MVGFHLHWYKSKLGQKERKCLFRLHQSLLLLPLKAQLKLNDGQQTFIQAYGAIIFSNMHLTPTQW